MFLPAPHTSAQPHLTSPHLNAPHLSVTSRHLVLPHLILILQWGARNCPEGIPYGSPLPDCRSVRGPRLTPPHNRRYRTPSRRRVGGAGVPRRRRQLSVFAAARRRLRPFRALPLPLRPTRLRSEPREGVCDANLAECRGSPSARRRTPGSQAPALAPFPFRAAFPFPWRSSSRGGGSRRGGSYGFPPGTTSVPPGRAADARPQRFMPAHERTRLVRRMNARHVQPTRTSPADARS
eukprot:gene7849-biopygen8413